MPKLPHISGSDAARALEHLGFIQIGQKGSHLIMRRGSAGCIVPLHREIKIGVFAGVLRQPGVTPEDFIAKL